MPPLTTEGEEVKPADLLKTNQILGLPNIVHPMSRPPRFATAEDLSVPHQVLSPPDLDYPPI